MFARHEQFASATPFGGNGMFGSFGTPGFGSPFGTPGFGSPGFGSQGFGSRGFGTPGMGSTGFSTPGMGSQGFGSHGMGLQGFGGSGGVGTPQDRFQSAFTSFGNSGGFGQRGGGGGNFSSTSSSISFGPDGTKVTKTTVINNGQKQETILKEKNGKVIEKIVDGQNMDLRLDNGGNRSDSNLVNNENLVEADPVLLQQLVDFGVVQQDAEDALKATNNSSVNAALDWLYAHS